MTTISLFSSSLRPQAGPAVKIATPSGNLQPEAPASPLLFAGGYSAADADKQMKSLKRFVLGAILTLLAAGTGIGVLISKGCNGSQKVSSTAPAQSSQQ